MVATYLDSSAIVKLVIAEDESTALRRHLRRRRPLVSSALARTEVLRALLFEGEEGRARATAVLQSLDLLRVTDRVLNDAARLLPPEIRSLDAIHLATAGLLGAELGQIVSYDDRMLGAAKRLGMRTASPV
ncbi:MAG: type II toxin-antitoxin system VapC family toxin [Candidatus Dormiibacterota bacterium]